MEALAGAQPEDDMWWTSYLGRSVDGKLATERPSTRPFASLGQRRHREAATAWLTTPRTQSASLPSSGGMSYRSVHLEQIIADEERRSSALRSAVLTARHQQLREEMEWQKLHQQRPQPHPCTAREQVKAVESRSWSRGSEYAGRCLTPSGQPGLEPTPAPVVDISGNVNAVFDTNEERQQFSPPQQYQQLRQVPGPQCTQNLPYPASPHMQQMWDQPLSPQLQDPAYQTFESAPSTSSRLGQGPVPRPPPRQQSLQLRSADKDEIGESGAQSFTIGDGQAEVPEQPSVPHFEEAASQWNPSPVPVTAAPWEQEEQHLLQMKPPGLSAPTLCAPGYLKPVRGSLAFPQAAPTQQPVVVPWRQPVMPLPMTAPAYPLAVGVQQQDTISPAIVAMHSEMGQMRDELECERALVDQNAEHMSHLDLCCGELAQRLEESQRHLESAREDHLADTIRLKRELGAAIAERTAFLSKSLALETLVHEQQEKHTREKQSFEERLGTVEQQLQAPSEPPAAEETEALTSQVDAGRHRSHILAGAGPVPPSDSTEARFAPATDLSMHVDGKPFGRVHERSNSSPRPASPILSAQGDCSCTPPRRREESKESVWEDDFGPPRNIWVITPKRFARYEEAFRKVDVNHDGFAERQEVGEALRTALNPEELSRVWSLSDVDRDGRLSFHEFLCAMHLTYCRMREGVPVPPVLPPELATLLPERHDTVGLVASWLPEPQELAQYRELFKTFDVSEVGSVAPDIGRELFERSQLPMLELSHIWKMSDFDGDGRLSADEFVCAMALLVRRRQGLDLPAVLPPELKAQVCRRSSPRPPAASPRPPSPSREPPELTPLPVLDSPESRPREAPRPPQSWATAPADSLQPLADPLPQQLPRQPRHHSEHMPHEPPATPQLQPHSAR